MAELLFTGGGALGQTNITANSMSTERDSPTKQEITQVLKFPFKSLKKIDGALCASSNFTTQTKHGHINWTLAQVLPAFNTLTTAESNNSRQLSYSDCWPQSEVQLYCYLLVLEMLDSKCTDFTLQPLICHFRLALFLRSTPLP